MPISPHEFKVYDAVKEAAGFMTVKGIVARTGIALRTANQHAKKLTATGIFERVEIFDGYRYRIAKGASKTSHFQILEKAREIFT